MKTFVLSVFSLFFTVALVATEPAKEVKVDIKKSTINWTGKKVTGQHTGTIDLKSANLYMEDGNITGGKFVIDMTTITVTDLSGSTKGKLEGHLSSDDFFGVATYPEAIVEITNASKTDKPNTYNIDADVTIKGITEPVSFVATVTDNNATADITVDRSKFNVRYGSGSFFDGLGDKMIYDDFELSVNLVMNK